MGVAFNTHLFFDSEAVRRSLGAGLAKALGRIGGTVRLIARRSMRAGGKGGKVSLPGEPPRTHKGQIKSLLQYAYDPASQSVVIGPLPFGGVEGMAIVPKRLEEGGSLPKRKNPRRRRRVVGKSGEIRVGGPKSKTTKNVARSQTGGMAALGFEETRPVTYAKLRTQAQADLANKINEELYGPSELPAVRIAPRPFMSAAHEKAKTQYAELFRDTII